MAARGARRLTTEDRNNLPVFARPRVKREAGIKSAHKICTIHREGFRRKWVASFFPGCTSCGERSLLQLSGILKTLTQSYLSKHFKNSMGDCHSKGKCRLFFLAQGRERARVPLAASVPMATENSIQHWEEFLALMLKWYVANNNNNNLGRPDKEAQPGEGVR